MTLRVSIFQYSDGSYCIRWKWHWYGSSRHLHVEKEECIELVKNLILANEEKTILERKHHINDK